MFVYHPKGVPSVGVGLGNIRDSLPDDNGKTNESQYRDFLISSQNLACEDNLTFLDSFPDDSFKLIVTLPPCNLGKDYETRMSVDDYVESQRRVIRECIRVLNPNKSICWQVGYYADSSEIESMDSIKSTLRSSYSTTLNSVKKTCQMSNW